jgi:hypothetical protein
MRGLLVQLSDDARGWAARAKSDANRKRGRWTPALEIRQIDAEWVLLQHAKGISPLAKSEGGVCAGVLEAVYCSAAAAFGSIGGIDIAYERRPQRGLNERHTLPTSRIRRSYYAQGRYERQVRVHGPCIEAVKMVMRSYFRDSDISVSQVIPHYFDTEESAREAAAYALVEDRERRKSEPFPHP